MNELIFTKRIIKEGPYKGYKQVYFFYPDGGLMAKLGESTNLRKDCKKIELAGMTCKLKWVENYTQPPGITD